MATALRTNLRQRFTRGRRYYLLLALILAIGCFVRLWNLAPAYSGINQDEASAAYDAFAIMTTGMDRNGTPIPAYLIAWGSGQSAGLAYLMIPFIKLLGLNVLAIRLPMALIGCISLFTFYSIVRRHPDPRFALLGSFLFAIFPWHILKSRWALDANLFPDLLLWGIALLCTGLAGGKKRWFYLAFAMFGLSAWGYALSYVVLPLFLLPVAFVLWRKKTLSLPHLLGCFGALLLMAWPVVLVAVVAVFGLPTLHTPLFTIPAMPFARTGELSLLSGGLGALLTNARELLHLLISQDDGFLYDAVPGFGIVYIISLPLAIVGLLRCVLPASKGGTMRNIVPGGWLFLPLVAAGLVLGLLILPRIYRVNALWFPLAWFWLLGCYELMQVGALWRRTVVALYLCFFALLCNTGAKNYTTQLNYSFDGGLLEAVRYADSLEKTVYIAPENHSAYVKVLFALQTPVQEYMATEKETTEGAYTAVHRCGKWQFRQPDDTNPSPDYLVIAREDFCGTYVEAGWEATAFAHFYVLQPPPGA